MPFSLAVTSGCDISIVDIGIQSRLIYDDGGSTGPEICAYCNVLQFPWHILLLSRLGIHDQVFRSILLLTPKPPRCHPMEVRRNLLTLGKERRAITVLPNDISLLLAVV